MPLWTPSGLTAMKVLSVLDMLLRNADAQRGETEIRGKRGRRRRRRRKSTSRRKRRGRTKKRERTTRPAGKKGEGKKNVGVFSFWPSRSRQRANGSFRCYWCTSIKRQTQNMRTPSPKKQQGVKRHPSTPLSPLVKRDHVRRRRTDADTPAAIATTLAAPSVAPQRVEEVPSPSSPSVSLSAVRQLSLQQFQLSRLTAVVAFLETERKLSRC